MRLRPSPSHEAPRHLRSRHHPLRSGRRTVPGQGPPQRREVEPHHAGGLRGHRLNGRERPAHYRGEAAPLDVGRRLRRGGEDAHRRHGRRERARDRSAHQPGRRNGLQGSAGAHSALLQEPAEQRRRADALLSRRRRPGQDPRPDLQHPAGHRARHSGRSGDRAVGPSQYRRDQGKLGQRREAYEDGASLRAGLPGARRVRSHPLAVPDGGRCGRDTGGRECRALRHYRNLGSLARP